LPTIQHFYTIISKGNEKVTVIYESDLNEDNFENLLTKNLKRPSLTYTSKGIHKDDLRLK
jgi:DNA replication and repair protein RecF